MRTALFIHHSIGRQTIHGGLRRLLAGKVALWDHDYNEIGLSDPDGTATGRAFPVPGDDTDPPGLLTLLRGLADGAGWPVPAHDLLVLKSCFPNSAVGSVPAMQEEYGALRDIARKLPQAVLLLTSPPLVIESTGPAEARRAEEVADWLVSTWTGNGLHCANLFSALSYRRGPLRGTLRTGYRARRPRDSHLSPAGERAAARFVSDAILAACPVVAG